MAAPKKGTAKGRVGELKPKQVTGKSSESVRGGATNAKVWDYIKSNTLQDKAKKT